jgi:hypothetical protein
MGTLPKHHARSPLQGERSNFFRDTFWEPHGIATLHATNHEAIMLCPAQGSREALPSSDKEAPPDITIHCTNEGIKCGKKRSKQRPQKTMTTTDHNREAGGSGVRCISTAAKGDKRQARQPTDHFKRLLKEACPNHAYHVRHKLNNCDVMRSFMTSGSLTWCAELDENPGGSDTTPFPGENALMAVYGGRLPLGRCHVSNLIPRASARCGRGYGSSGV